MLETLQFTRSRVCPQSPASNSNNAVTLRERQVWQYKPPSKHEPIWLVSLTRRPWALNEKRNGMKCASAWTGRSSSSKCPVCVSNVLCLCALLLPFRALKLEAWIFCNGACATHRTDWNWTTGGLSVFLFSVPFGMRKATAPVLGPGVSRTGC